VAMNNLLIPKIFSMTPYCSRYIKVNKTKAFLTLYRTPRQRAPIFLTATAYWWKTIATIIIFAIIIMWILTGSLIAPTWSSNFNAIIIVIMPQPQLLWHKTRLYTNNFLRSKSSSNNNISIWSTIILQNSSRSR